MNPYMIENLTDYTHGLTPMLLQTFSLSRKKLNPGLYHQEFDAMFVPPGPNWPPGVGRGPTIFSNYVFKIRKHPFVWLDWIKTRFRNQVFHMCFTEVIIECYQHKYYHIAHFLNSFQARFEEQMWYDLDLRKLDQKLPAEAKQIFYRHRHRHLTEIMALIEVGGMILLSLYEICFGGQFSWFTDKPIDLIILWCCLGTYIYIAWKIYFQRTLNPFSFLFRLNGALVKLFVKKPKLKIR